MLSQAGKYFESTSENGGDDDIVVNQLVFGHF